MENAMREPREKPIGMSSAAVRALLDGSKTTIQRLCDAHPVVLDAYGAKGDRFWVQEIWCEDYGKPLTAPLCCYRADYPDNYDDAVAFQHDFGLRQWINASLMPREYSRILLEIVDIKLVQVVEDDYREIWGEEHDLPFVFPNKSVPYKYVCTIKKIEQEPKQEELPAVQEPQVNECAFVNKMAVSNLEQMISTIKSGSINIESYNVENRSQSEMVISIKYRFTTGNS